MRKRRPPDDPSFSASRCGVGAPETVEDLTPALRARLERLVLQFLEIGLGCVHSAEREDDGGSESFVDCEVRLESCRAVCCSFRFALTTREVEEGLIRWDRRRAYLIAQAENGYCVHHDPGTHRCRMWNVRPLRCRRYDCRRESRIWQDAARLILFPGVFRHLPDEP